MAEVPGMSPEKVVLADLQGKAEYFIVQKLNPVLKANGFMGVDYISVAIYRTWDKAFSKEYRDELKILLVQFFGAMLGSVEKGAAVVEEWPTVMEWRCQRVAFAHPLSDNLGKPINAQKLASLKEAVLTSDAYRDVRNAALLLLKAAESLPAE